MWINPNHILVELNFNNKNIIVVKQAVEKITHQFDNVKIIREFTAKELIGENVITPLIDRIIPYSLSIVTKLFIKN